MGAPGGTGWRLRSAGLVLAALGALAGAPAAAQQLPSDAYRRSPFVADDPFWPLMGSRAGLVVSGRGAASNNALDFEALGALVFLADRDSLRAVDALDALGLVPKGEGLGGEGDAEGTLRVAVPLGRRLSVGLSAGPRAWSSALVDEAAVALLRDGNAARSDFGLGRTRGEVLVAAEAGVHFTWRAGRILGGGGPEVTFGAGGRRVRPLYYAGFRSLLEDRGAILVSPDTIRARISVATLETPSVKLQGDGYLVDGLVRAVWPASRFALEVSVTGLGSTTVEGVVRRGEEVDLATTRLDEVVDVVDGLALRVRDTVDVTLSPPAEIGLTASTWWVPGLQLDARLSVPAGGEFARPPPAVELLSTLRPVRAWPLRAGIRVGGHGDLGYRVGTGWEGRRFLARLSAGSTGGLFGRSRGLSTRISLGVWF